MKKILLVASGGGHWVQLRRFQKAFSNCHQVYVTVSSMYQQDIPDNATFYEVNDATRWDKIALARLLMKLFFIILKERPSVILSTGAAPGFLALKLGKIFGCKTIWIDSIANVQELSLSGQKIKNSADICLTQWEHLAKGKVKFIGNCL